jgi:hypothetical protein
MACPLKGVRKQLKTLDLEAASDVIGTQTEHRGEWVLASH